MPAQAIAVLPSYALAHRALGALQRERGELEAAERSYRAAVRLEPAVAKGYALLGVVRMRTGLPVVVVRMFLGRFRRSTGRAAATAPRCACEGCGEGPWSPWYPKMVSCWNAMLGVRT